MPTVNSEEASEVPAFACCSAGIGRWFWVAWASESDARALSPALASGYEASAARAEAKAVERVGPRLKRLPAKWASGYKRRGGAASRSSRDREGGGDDATRPKARIGRLRGRSRRDVDATRLAFLYSAAGREPPDSLGHVAVARHRIVRRTAGKIHVECDPFDEDEWARRGEGGEGAPGDAPKVRTLAVDRVTLRTEGRFRIRHGHRDLTFYASEEEGIRDVEAALTARYAWCATLGVRFPCSADSIKAAYRRLARTLHPDAGGDPAEFRRVEQAYREALDYFSQADDAVLPRRLE
jgi:DnaJ domain